MAEKVFTNCTNSGPVTVYVKDGKVVRVRPLVVDPEDYRPSVESPRIRSRRPRRLAQPDRRSCVQAGGHDGEAVRGVERAPDHRRLPPHQR